MTTTNEKRKRLEWLAHEMSGNEVFCGAGADDLLDIHRRISAALSATPAHAPGKAGDREGLDEICEVAWKAYRFGTPEKRGPGYTDSTPSSAWDAGWAAAVAALAPSPTGNEAPRGVVPAGWKVVPEEPTEEMQIAGHRVRTRHIDRTGLYAGTDEIWSAMLAAAPPPPVSTEPGSRAGAEREAARRISEQLGQDFDALQPYGLSDTFTQDDFLRAARAALHLSPPTASGAAAPVVKGEWNALVGPLVERCKVASAFGQEAVWNARGADALGQVLQHMADVLDSLIAATPTPAPHPVPADQTKEGAR